MAFMRPVGLRPMTPSRARREASAISLGSPVREDPCPHALVAWDEVPDPTAPDNPHRRLMRRVEVACERAGRHNRAVHDNAHRSGNGHTWS